MHANKSQLFSRQLRLHELKTFIQETNDEDELKKMSDDEPDHMKFLVVVLQDGDNDTKGLQENENANNEDEENNADFQLKLDETLRVKMMKIQVMRFMNIDLRGCWLLMQDQVK